MAQSLEATAAFYKLSHEALQKRFGARERSARSAVALFDGSHASTDRTIDKWERVESADVRRRDFTGHDFTAWVYDLFRPDEAYAARGVHPSGAGIRRYVRVADLTPQERSYLRRQGRLSLINFLDPKLAGVDNLDGRFNVTASHTLFVPRALITIRDYANREPHYPGIEAELPRAKISPRIALWRAAGVEAKSAGWVQGNVHLGSSVALRVGVLLPR